MCGDIICLTDAYGSILPNPPKPCGIILGGSRYRLPSACSICGDMAELLIADPMAELIPEPIIGAV